jgi:translation initiation factor 3 subunit A
MQDRDPLHLCQIAAPHLAALEGKVINLSSNAPVAAVDLGQHLSQLKSVAVLKMMRQLSGVYSVMRIEKLSSLVPLPYPSHSVCPVPGALRSSLLM